MITTGFDARVKVQQIIENQLPEYVISENPKASEFLKQYYISQEYQGGPIDIAENLDQYINLNNLTPEVIAGVTSTSSDISSTDTTIVVNSTKGFPNQYGLLKIDDEIITYTGITTNSFTGCVRGFSGITTYRNQTNPEELIFSSTLAESHLANKKVENLSVLFLKEFYKKIKYSFASGFENLDFVPQLNVNNFIKEIKTFYQSKGTDEAFKILFKVLYGVNPRILNLESFLIKPSQSEFIRREILVTERISGDPNRLVGQVVKRYDDSASGPVSEVELISRNNRIYYKLQLFAGFNQQSLIEGQFNITGKTKTIGQVSIGSSIITVDSTIGFPESGILYSGDNIITYTEKSINQFFGCSGVSDTISSASEIRSNDIIYGYEDGDLTKKVELRVTGVLSEIEDQKDLFLLSEGDSVSVKSIGEKIKNPDGIKTYKQELFNSWIYNTSSRYEISSFSNNVLTLFENPDKSSLKVGDIVDVLDRNSENIILGDAVVLSINSNLVSLNSNITGVNSSRRLSIRRKLKYATSSGIPLKYSNITSNVQNTYISKDQKTISVAGNSLPDYVVDIGYTRSSLSITSSSNLTTIFQGYDPSDFTYSIISFDTDVPFINGDAVVYTGSNLPLTNLTFGTTYYIEILPDGTSRNRVRLYNSRSFIGTNNYVRFELENTVGQHDFTLASQSGKIIEPKKYLATFPIEQNIQSGENTQTPVGPVGLLVNGVEILNYKSNDKIYYGPVEELKIYNSGIDYDVINPPSIKISSPGVGIGSTAYADAVVRGSVRQVLVDPNDVDLVRIISATISGGNGSGAVLEPVLEKTFREIEFSAEQASLGGGVDVSNETITFLRNHNLTNGLPIVYSNNGNASLGIGTFDTSNTDQGRNLINGGTYYPQILNSRSIYLYQTINDLNAGINTVGFTTINTGGIHKFRLLEGKNVLKDIKVINGGSNYENRSLKVNPSGISTINHTVNFTNHNFKDGDLVRYSTQGSTIAGLSTSNQYYVLKVDNSSFRLAYAGPVGIAASNTDFLRKNYIKFGNFGSGYQIFSYPQIELSLNVEYAGFIGTITATPIVKGNIVDAYLYDGGAGYGSKTLNFHKKPSVSIQNGINAQVRPVVSGGKIIGVELQNGGRYYYSTPDLIISGSGIGATMRAVINNGSITDVVIINGGTNYNSNDTTIAVVPSGRNAIIESFVRPLTINNYSRFSDQLLQESENNLTYGVVGYSTVREGSSFSDPDPITGHSKIIGWAYDGNPIYGPYGFSDPNNINSRIIKLNSSYVLDINSVNSRPSTSEFESGFFVEDYKFNNSGNLDVHNGRYAKTPEFPNGVYAYYVGLKTDTLTNRLAPDFPYFIGNNYRSTLENTSITDQSFDFNSSSLIRNTFPYRLNEPYSGNDFIVEANDSFKQTSIINSTSSGSIQEIEIKNPGDSYKVNDTLIFNNSGTGGGGASAFVRSIKGKPIYDLETSTQIYENVIFNWLDENNISVTVSPYHTLIDNDKIEISGISTFIDNLLGPKIIGVSTNTTTLREAVSSNTSLAGVVTDISISTNVPSRLSIGSTIGIGTETFSILNIFNEENVLRVRRGVSAGHTTGSLVTYFSDSFNIPVKSDYFESRLNDIVYFNPNLSVGVGTLPGNQTSISFPIASASRSISVPTQSIYLPNHPFSNNQRIRITKPSSSSAIIVANTPEDGLSGSTFTLPLSGDSQYVYIINKSRDYIGIVTQVGLSSISNGLFFINNGSNNYQYKVESDFSQVTGTVQKIQTRVSVSTDHNLQYGDQISLTVNPSLSVGIGTSTSIRLKYDGIYNKLLVNSIGFTSSLVNTTNNSINLPLHELKTGDKVFYSSDDLISNGLTTGGYFVYRNSANSISLCDTYIDAVSVPPRIVSIASTGGNLQELSLINPKLNVIRNNDVIFDTSHPSLFGYDFKIFYDKNLSNQFISVGTTSQFLLQKVGSIGIGSFSNSNITINYNEEIPTKIYYSLEKNGELVPQDTDVLDYSEILYEDSFYDGTYNIYGIGSTTFNISLSKIPEKLSYTQSECSNLSYTTNSIFASGPINDISIVSPGFTYNRLPNISGISTLSSGSNAILKAKTNTIGEVNDIRVVSEGFEYTSDKTLKPKADVPTVIGLDNSDKITSVSVIDGGRNFISTPILVLVNTYTRERVDSGLLRPTLRGNSIVSVDVVEEPKGLQAVNHIILTTNNSNGVQVSRILSYTNGIVECEISTPAINGFLVAPFEVGDRIFVEGLQKQSFTDELGVITSPGNGFNSENNGYNFFEVTEFINSNPAILKYNIGEFTNNAGTPVEIQNAFNSIVKSQNCPTFSSTRVLSEFYANESILVNGQSTDLKIKSTDLNIIKVTGEYPINQDDILFGSVSGNFATVGYVNSFNNYFKVDYSNKRNFGWKDDVGKLNLDTQVIADNNYYQSLSYTIKSTIEYKNFKDSVNRMVHPVGMKNFGDTEIFSQSNVAIAVTEKLSQVLDFVSEKRVDTINNFDFVLDYEPTSNTSSFIKFRNKKLADYIDCRTNRVLQIDDISNRFSSQEFNRDQFVELVEYPITDFYSKYLVQIMDEDKTKTQLSEVVILNNFDNTYTLNKVDLFSLEKLGDLSGDFGPPGDPVLKFTPVDPFTTNYNIKVYRESFSPNPFNIGIGFTEIGFTRLSSKTERLTSLTGLSTDVFRAQSTLYNAIYSNIFVLNEDTYDMNYFEIVGFYDGQNEYISEYYFDTQNLISGASSGYIGTFGLTVENNVLKLGFTKNTSDNVLVKAKVVGFGTTAAGIGTYRFTVDGQIDGTERTARLESNYYNSSGITTFISYNSQLDSSVKSLIKVGIGSTVTSLHQIMVVSDQVRVNIQQYPFVSIGSSLGIGTFGASMVSGTVYVTFYPDLQYSASDYTIQTFNQVIYTDPDEFNIPDQLEYGTSEESLELSFYGALNTFGKDKLDFDLNYNTIPIFEKTFNPKNSSILNLSTGVFTIPNHFFQTGEELIYTPFSTLIDVPATSVGIGSTLVSGTVFNGDIIVGFATITGIAASTGITTNGTLIIGDSIPSETTITSIGRTYSYFVGNVVSAGSSVITGIANTAALRVGSGIYSGNNDSLGTILSVGINSITASVSIVGGNDRLYYSTDNNIALTLSNVATATTFRREYTTGIVTDICPERVYAIKLSKDTFQLTGTFGGSGVGFTFTSTGSGNLHKLEMKKKLEKSLISVNGVNQYPIIYTPLSFTLESNGGTVGAATTYITLSGISSITPRDLIKIEDEFIYVSNVGFATENTGFGPITGIGTIPVVEVRRGWVGTSATTHLDGTSVRVYKGAYNIVGNKIWFTEAPDGKGNNDRLDSSSLALPKSTFNGRVYLRQDYTTNKIYDDISTEFNGIGRTFTMRKDDEITSGIEPGSGLVFINDVFQTPDTDNNSGNNYTFIETVGITSVTFTSVTRPNTDDIIVVDYDVNQNQVPRGGIIVSLASTGGLGYAPLVGASVTATLNSGSIVSIGIGTSGTFGSGYYGNVSIGVTDLTGSGAVVDATVGAGGTLIFNVVSGGSGYTNPVFEITDPSYSDLEVVGVYRVATGSTTETGIGLSMTIDVGGSTSSVGIGSTFYEVKSFKVSKPGYSFRLGDVFEVVGLVTDARLNSPIEPLRFTVTEVFTDSFASWQMGEFDYIDSIKNLQNGTRTRFPLYRNDQLLSFEADTTDVEASLIDFDTVLLIYLNGVMQEPGVSYTFEGGTTFRFTEAPKPEDNVAIFFYRGTRGIDSVLIDVNETIKVGDTLQINKNNNIPGTIAQDPRIVSLIESADIVETGIYLGDGIDENNYKPVDWSKQKRDLVINQTFEYKTRDSLETLVFPTAKIIKDLSSTDINIFVDDATLFNYEENTSTTDIGDFSVLIVPEPNQVSAKIRANVGSDTTIESLIVEDGGSGYIGTSVELKISKPLNIGVGIGTTATAYATVSAGGTLTTPIVISNPGFGYTSSISPSILIPPPLSSNETIDGVRFVQGFSGIITGITTSIGTSGNPLAITFQVKYDSTSDINSLLVGYPIYVFDTTVGNGLTSIDNDDNSIVGIGSTFVDNIYYIHSITRNNLTGIITSNILSTTNTIGIETSNSDTCGRFSWGRLSGFNRSPINTLSIGVTGYTVNSGLTTFPSIQRRGYGLRDGGSLVKEFD